LADDEDDGREADNQLTLLASCHASRTVGWTCWNRGGRGSDRGHFGVMLLSIQYFREYSLTAVGGGNVSEGYIAIHGAAR